MAVQLKPLEEQVIVITGASSGIGRATAEMAADGGARLVLAARNEEALREVADECARRGGRAVVVAADVGKRADIERIAEVAEDSFGGFDTWANDAAVALYGKMTEISAGSSRSTIGAWSTDRSSRPSICGGAAAAPSSTSAACSATAP
jgi:NADP-dependent 3-hydroxy acid dehydrogenase YdfG